jgi:hypothetical protein
MQTPIIKPVCAFALFLLLTIPATAEEKTALILEPGQTASRTGVLITEELLRSYVEAKELEDDYQHLIDVLDRKLHIYDELEVLWNKKLSNYKDLVRLKEEEIEIIKTEIDLETGRRTQLEKIINRNRTITGLCVSISAGVVSGVVVSGMLR